MSSVIAEVTAAAITHERVARELSAPEHGAQLVFWGVVRGTNAGRAVVAVTYDAHVALAERTFRDIGEEARARWGSQLRVVVIHRVGRLDVGEASVAIGVASPHREAAYEASRHVIEQLKVRSPVWKQEHYADGAEGWLPGHPLARSAAGR
jgi:molybdopterin synthase catalytic subunit